MQRSMVVRISWSIGVACVPMSEEMCSDLLLWLRNRLRSKGPRELRGMRIQVYETTSRNDVIGQQLYVASRKSDSWRPDGAGSMRDQRSYSPFIRCTLSDETSMSSARVT